MNLNNFIRVGRYDLPVGTVGEENELALEVSAVTYNWDSDTLFLLGDEGTSIVQVSKTGVLIDTMQIAAGFITDPEGLTYIGDGEFVLVEERTRTATSLTYEGGGTFEPSDPHSAVVLGTTIGNVGLEGLSFDPLSGSNGFVLVKEKDPQGVFQSDIDFDAGTASNGSATTVNSTNLFDPAVLGVTDFADIFALSLLPSTSGTDDEDNLLLLSQEPGIVLEVNRADGSIVSQLVITGDADNALSVVDQGHEGLTMDRDGFLYLVSEQGGGSNTPQLWVYQIADFTNSAPTGLGLANEILSLAENSNTTARLKVADLVVTDDGIGNNAFSVSGADAAFFEADATGLYIKAGTLLDFETKTSYSVTITVDDPGVGGTPDASTEYVLAITDEVNESAAASVYISEVAPWSSGNSLVAVDWFEVSNTDSVSVDITGWRMDDDLVSFGNSAALGGVTSIAAGELVVFLNTNEGNFAAVLATFKEVWFDGETPAGIQFGWYAGPGLGTGGDAVALFNGEGSLITNASFGPSPSASPFATFENSAAQDGVTLTSLSVDGVGGAFTVQGASGGQEIGSPGTVGKIFVSEAAPWSSGNSNSPVGEDWFELTNSTSAAVNITGWRFDDDLISFAESDPLVGVTGLAPGELAIFLNTNAEGFETVKAAFIANWFGGTAPASLQFGHYDGAGLGNGGDAVFLFDGAGTAMTGFSFGPATTAPAFATFDNAAGVEFALVNTLSSPGTNGAFQISNSFGNSETGSPGTVTTAEIQNNAPPSAVVLTPVITELDEGTNTPVRIKLADVAIIDDGAGFNALSLSGADAAFFTVDASGLYLNPLTQLDFETKASYTITIEADDPTVGVTPDASTTFTLTVADVAAESLGIAITEVAPWSSGDSPVGEDWFEITNFGTTAIDLTGWAFDDNSASLIDADPLLGVASIGAGKSVIYLNTDATGFVGVRDAFIATWFNGSAPASLTFGYYDGAGLGTGGDAVVLFGDEGTVQANIAFGASPEEAPFATFDNSAGADNLLIETTSIAGVNGAFDALGGAAEIGSPGRVATPNDPPMVDRATLAGEDVVGGTGNDRLYGEAGANNISAFAGNDKAYGLGGDDRLDGGAGNDRLYGGIGNDLLIGGDGNDVIYGDNPDGNDNEGFADIFVFDDDDGFDKVFDFETGLDKVVLTNGTEYSLTYKAGATILTYGDTVVTFHDELLTNDDFAFAL